MCGIVAIMSQTGAPVDPDALRRGADTLRHRGPDDEGYALAGPGATTMHLAGPDTVISGLPRIEGAAPDEQFIVGLANRRLAILDPTPAGHGPMAAAGGTVVLTYNGEVYNYLELGRELTALGHRFQTGTDTEVVLSAYLEWGDECFARFNGMWGLAIWDGRDGSLVLSRDRLGIKPLYVADIDGALVAASEPVTLLELGADRGMDRAAAYAYLAAGYADWGTQTFFKSIRRVEAGSVERHRLDGASVARSFWRLPTESRNGSRDHVSRFRELFLDSVRLQLRSDVPVGTCLSGGLDSSSVAMAIQRERDEGCAQHAFTCAFPGTPLDETHYARAVAEAAALQAHVVAPVGEDLFGELDAVIAAQGEPFPSSSSYAQWRVMRLARNVGVTVLLDGQGGDELLAGYPGFVPYAAAGALRRLHALAAVRELAAAPNSTSAALRTALLLAPGSAAAAIRTRSRRRSTSHVASALADEHAAGLVDRERIAPSLEAVLEAALLRTTLPVLLRSEDRMSMAHSREARVPFLDHRLVELAASAPASLKLSRGKTKLLLRRSLADLLPRSVAARTDKVGFATPEAQWLRGAGSATLSETIAGLPDDGFVDVRGVELLTARLRNGDDTAAAPLWRVLCFERWSGLTGAYA
jgi:asparagine synthase (glutamine-hydrolysing)